MEFGKQIKRLRNERGWNQEEFAEKAYVSRQTVSNWENEKSYPDVKSLLILSDLFGVSIDELVKGDVEIMKEKISKESIKATPHNHRLTPLHAICLHIFRHITQILLERRQPSCVEFRQSDEKSDCASCAQWLCGIALRKES